MSAPALMKVDNGIERADTVLLDFTQQQIELIKATILPGASLVEFDLFMNWCRVKGLDPLSGEAYAVRQGGKLQPAAQIAGLRKIASRTGLYGPQHGPHWCGQDGQWTDVWLQDIPPAAARVGVKQIGHDDYTYSVALWRECGASKAGDGRSPWARQPAHMLAIRAEAAALRRVFPTDLGGVYIREELDQDPIERRRGKPLVTDEDRAIVAFMPDFEEAIDADTGQSDTQPITTLEQARLDVWGKVKGLGWEWEDFNETRKRLKLPPLDKMTASQVRMISEEYDELGGNWEKVAAENDAQEAEWRDADNG